MANHSSSKKSVRKTVKRTKINQARESRIKTFISKVEAAIAGGKKEEAQAALRTAQSEIMRGVTKNILKLNTASRKISRLSAKVKAVK